jgi:glycosyltransferase involved in cell wall biosynthesis
MDSILHVIPYFVPAHGFGGPVTACLDVAATQVAIGHRVVVVTTDALDERERVDALEDVVEGIEVYRFRNVSARLAKAQNLYLPIGLRRWIDRHLREFAVVHLHDYYTYLNVLVAGRCRRLGIRYVVQPHGVAVPPPDQRLYLVKRAFGELWGHAMLRGARNVLAVSEIERARLVEALPDCRARIRVVGNGLRLSTSGPQARDRARLGLSPEHKLIITLGRLHETKGFDRLIRAFAVLARRDPTWRLCLIGSDDGAQTSLEALVSSLDLGDRVRFLGLRTGADKDAILAAGDIFALLSRYESFSIAVLEALAQGLPVCLAATVGVAAQLLPLGCAIVTEDPDDAEATARNLERTYEARLELGAQARPAAARYDIRTVIDALHEHYGLAEAERRRGPSISRV